MRKQARGESDRENERNLFICSRAETHYVKNHSAEIRNKFGKKLEEYILFLLQILPG